MSDFAQVSLSNLSIATILRKHILLSLSSQLSISRLSFSRLKQNYRCYFALELNRDPRSQEEVFRQLLTPKQGEPSLEFLLKLTSSNCLDFLLCDHSLVLWLNYLLSNFSELQVKINSQEQPDFFLHYVHARCCSLLRLGEQEGLIKQDFSRWSQVSWSYLTSSQEKIFFWQLLELSEIEITHSSLRKLAQATLDVERYCRIWGDVQKDNPNLSKTRLALFALSRDLLAYLVRTQFEVDLWTEL